MSCAVTVFIADNAECAFDPRLTYTDVAHWQLHIPGTRLRTPDIKYNIFVFPWVVNHLKYTSYFSDSSRSTEYLALLASHSCFLIVQWKLHGIRSNTSRNRNGCIRPQFCLIKFFIDISSQFGIIFTAFLTHQLIISARKVAQKCCRPKIRGKQNRPEPHMYLLLQKMSK